MNSLLSMILVIVMAFSTVGGAVPAEGPVSFDAKISLDTEALLAAAGGEAGIPEESAQTAKVIGDILDVLTLKGVADKETVELDLFAGEDVLLSLGVKNTEEGSTFASSLLGSQVIYSSAELLEMMKQSMMGSIAQGASGADFSAIMAQYQNLDREQIKKDCEEWADALLQAISEKAGETETGEFAVDGMTFVARTPINMTYAELMELVITRMKDLLAKESFQPLLQAYSKDTDIMAELDKAVENLKNETGEDSPEMQMAIYSDGTEGGYCVCDMTRTVAATEEGQPAKEEKIYIGYGNVAGTPRSHVRFVTDNQNMDIFSSAREDGSADMEATVLTDSAAAEISANSDPDGNLDMVWNIKSQETSAIIHAKTEKAEDERINYSLDVYMGSTEKPMISVSGSAGKGGETVSVFEGENVTVIPMTDLMNPQDTTVSDQLTGTMAFSLLRAVTVLTGKLPEDSANWINTQVSAMMNPGASTETQQEAPATGD